MVLQEFLKNIDIRKVAVTIKKMGFDEEFAPEEVEAAYTKFIRMLLTLKPNASDDIMLAIPCMWDFDEAHPIYTESSLLKKKDLLVPIPEIALPAAPIEEMDMQSAEEWFNKFIAAGLPQSYAYEFSPWEDILGAEIDADNLSVYDEFEFAASVLNELSFNGFTRESQKERRDDLDRSIKECEKYMKLPPEERDKHFVPMDDVFSELGLHDTRTEEEKEADMLDMHRAMVFNAAEKYKAIRRYQKTCGIIQK